MKLAERCHHASVTLVRCVPVCAAAAARLAVIVDTSTDGIDPPKPTTGPIPQAKTTQRRAHIIQARLSTHRGQRHEMEEGYDHAGGGDPPPQQQLLMVDSTLLDQGGEVEPSEVRERQEEQRHARNVCLAVGADLPVRRR